MKRNFFSLLHRLLIKTSYFRFKGKILNSIWNKTWEYSINSYKGPIDFKLHGELVEFNNGFAYPLFINTYFSLNKPLVEIVSAVYRKKKQPITLIDIGAAIGDTMLLLFEKCPNMIEKFYCIDGDPEFFGYLENNLKKHKNGILIKALLSDYSTDSENQLVRTHLGTASSQGINKTNAITLDELLLTKNNVTNVDLIKIDVDGLDGKIIAGAIKLIEKYKPVIIFEWHPILYVKTGNSTSAPFLSLTEKGYTQFLFFDKLGNFNHLKFNPSVDEINMLSKLCLRNNFQEDWHFDIVALNNWDDEIVLDLMEMKYSSKKS